MSILNKTILLTGGTGSFGKAFISYLFTHKFRGVIRVYSRDEFKQYNLAQEFNQDRRLRFFIGDVRDLSRLKLAADGVDVVIHAAALKNVPILEYNPFEAIKTNILGSQNVIDAAIATNVKKSILISSDKAVSPMNLYGATKMVAEKLFVDANSYVGERKIKFSVVRYGNVMGSRGSVVPLFLKQREKGVLTITDERMTRFWITLPQGVKLVVNSLDRMLGGEIFIPKIPSIKVVDLARVIAPKAKFKVTGIRPGEKVHEFLISIDEARHCRRFKDYFVIFPEFNFREKKIQVKSGKNMPDMFSYSSDKNDIWLTSVQISKMLSTLTSND